jgi:predicted secreted protein
MATTAGKDGAVKLTTNSVAEVDTWSLDSSLDIQDITSFGDAWHRKAGTLKDWSGKFSGRLDMTDTNGQLAVWNALNGLTTVAIRLYVGATNYFSGTALIKQWSPKSSVDGMVEFDATFEGSGALSFT